jgi:hypothetical protein
VKFDLWSDEQVVRDPVRALSHWRGTESLPESKRELEESCTRSKDATNFSLFHTAHDPPMEADYAPQEQPNPDEVPAPEFDTSFFPAPSPYFHRYTSTNLALTPDSLISDVPGEPRPFLAKELEPPNIDWIVEEGSYSVFGETWPIEEHLPTLEEMGLREMYDKSQGELPAPFPRCNPCVM